MQQTPSTAPDLDSYTSPDPLHNITLAEMERAFADPEILKRGFQFDLRSCEVHDRTASMDPIKYDPGPDDASDRPGDDELAKGLNWYGPVSAEFEGHHTPKPVNMAVTLAAIREGLASYKSHKPNILRAVTFSLFGGNFPFGEWVQSWEINREAEA